MEELPATVGAPRGMSLGVRVLIVDDHLSFGEAMALLFRTMGGADVLGIATCGDDALEQVAQQQPDVVLMDVRLRGESGIQVTAEIKRRFPDVRVAMLTASADASDVRAAVRAGASGYLLKNAEARQLLAALQAIAAGETVISSHVVGHLARDAASMDLSENDLRLLRLLAEGHEQAAAARELAISESTLKRQLAVIQRKLDADNRVQAIVKAAKQGLI